MAYRCQSTIGKTHSPKKLLTLTASFPRLNRLSQNQNLEFVKVMSVKSYLVSLLVVVFTASSFTLPAAPVDAEYIGQFDKALVVNAEEFEQVVLKDTGAAPWASLGSFESSTHFTSSKVLHPRTGNVSVMVLLVETEDEDPIIFADVNGDKKITADEKFLLKQEKADNPFLWGVTIPLAETEGFFSSYPIFVRYFKSIKVEKMTPGDRLITQTTEVMARGSVDVKGSKVTVQYALPAGQKKVNPQVGWLGVDSDGDGNIDMDNLSPEAARADAESVVFRVGDTYLSTKKADVSKNQITLREHEAKDYKRLEVGIGKPFPDFSFTDFDNKKRTIAEYRGKYILLDIWGFWCPPCRKELPYIREAHKRFKGKNLEIIGLNTDSDFTISSMKKALNENGMIWTNAKLDSVAEFLSINLRISSYPTTFLISPEGKILSMSRQERDEPDLRGEDPLESLDEVLPD